MKLAIQWLAHAAFKIKLDEKVIYIDPRYLKKFKTHIEPFFKKPEKADIMLFTHHHADHCYPSSITKMRASHTKYIGPKRCRERIGNKLMTIEAGDMIDIDGIKINIVEAYNLNRRRSTGSLFHPKGLGVGFTISFGDYTIYHLGDTECIPEMGNLGKIDLILVPIGGKFTMNIEEGLNAIKLVKPKFAIPMHLHDTNPNEFKKRVEKETDTIVWVLEMGEEKLLM